MTERKFITAREAAQYLCLSLNKVYRLTCTKKIKHYKIGSRVMFLPSDLDEWMLAHEVKEV
jgi:excisionase family DNA binding protein